MFAIANLSAYAAEVQNPWTFLPKVPTGLRSDKAAFIEWGQNPATQHCFFSGYEGQDPNLRLSKGNPATILHGLVADFDTTIVTPEALLAIKTKCPGDIAPNYASLTISGGARLVWLLDEPVLLPPQELQKDWLKLVAKRMKITRFFPGLDLDAFLHVEKYYEAGTNWVSISPTPLPAALVCQWQVEVGNSFAWKKLASSAIPLEDVYREIEARFPGRWQGPFELGARGCRFWDPMAKNSTSAIVRETGMQCFSGATPFMSWGAIFGQLFVDKFQAEQTGAAVADVFYDGREYWRNIDDTDDWRCYNKEDLKLYLKVGHGLSTSVGKKENSSEVDRALHAIHESKRIEAALPFVHFPSGLLRRGGHRFLNISTTRVTAPAPDPVTTWGQGFPWLSSFLDGFFASSDQLSHFLAWLRRFYVGAYRQDPQQGQAIFIAGEAGHGKSLLSTGILSPLMGGHADASDYFLRETRFTSQILCAPIMVVDDTSPAADQTSHNKYSAMIKKITANMYHTYEKKFQAAGQVEWVGRVIVTCNLDPDSIRLLPNVEISVLDKISLFRCSEHASDFPPSSELRKILGVELPCLASWLLHTQTDEVLRGKNRFGVRSYHDNVLYSNALQSGASYSFLELLRSFLDCYADSLDENGQPRTQWCGTPTDLLRDMMMMEPIQSLARQYKPTQVATLLGQLKSRGYGFGRGRTADRRWWQIPVVLEDPKQGEQNDRVVVEPVVGPSAGDRAGDLLADLHPADPVVAQDGQSAG